MASDGHLDKLTASGEVSEIQTALQLGSSVSIASSPRRDHVYVGDGNNPSASIHRLDLASGEMTPVVPKLSSNIHGLALDPMTNVLYWTTGYGHSIMKANVDGQSDYKRRIAKVVHRFREEIPQGIAIDSCGRYLFWTNTNTKAPSIERSNLDGSNRTVIVSRELHAPLGVAVDQVERKLYWCQELEGVYFSIERSDLDGNNRDVMRSMHQQPFTLSIGVDFIYWADWTNKAVWKKDKNHFDEGFDPIKVHGFPNTPTGLVAFVDGEAKSDAECRAIIRAYETKKFEATTVITTVDSDVVTEADWNDNVVKGEFCLNNGAVLTYKDSRPVCGCLPGFTGERCEIEICFNYCLHGTCSMNKQHGGAACTCEPGYTGDRCEQDLCSEFCLNGGHCTIVGEKPSCNCHEPFKGDRCEITSKLCRLYCESELAMVSSQTDSEMQSLCLCRPVRKHEYQIDGFNGTAFLVPDGTNQMSLRTDSPLSNETNSALLITFGCICLLLLLAVILLVYKVINLRKRPRVKKRFIGSKTVTPTPLTNRPSPATDQCEINIENCCNMNICETPCFEPNLRTPRPGSKKEEKKTLLDSMENSQGGSHDDLY